MRPEPPASVTCEGETIRVETVPYIGRINERYQTGGTYLHRARGGPKLRLVRGMVLRSEQATVLHELMHHATERSGLKREFSLVKEERFIDYIDNWLLSLLQENPELVEYLTSKGEA